MKNPIIRRNDFAGGGLTDDEKTLMAAHTETWIQRVMRTDPIEHDKIIPAIKGIYAAAGLKEPRVIVVSSPLVMAMAGGFAAGILHMREKGFDITATDAATRAATRAATDDATDAATYAATYDATYAWPMSAALHFSAGNKKIALWLLSCSQNWWRMYQGGNMWASWDCYLTAARDVLKLKLAAHKNYEAWEQAAIHGGFRIMHADFCMVSDFPETLKIDEQNRPHCETGPSHKWRDGWSLYHWHGVKVPAEWIEEKSVLTPAIALSVENVEQRRAACEILGWHNVLAAPSLNPRIIDADEDHIGQLIAVDLPDAPDQWFIKYRCGTGRIFAEPVTDKRFNTALLANAGGNGYRGQGDPMSFIPFIRS